MHHKNHSKFVLDCLFVSIAVASSSVALGQTFQTTVIAQTGGMLGDKTVRSLNLAWVSLNDHGEVAFQADFVNPDGSFGGGIFVNDRLVVDMAVPLHGKTLASLGAPSINNSGNVVFSGRFFDDQGVRQIGVFTLDAIIADLSQPVHGVAITSISSPPRINDLGEVLFYGTNSSTGTAMLFTQGGWWWLPGCRSKAERRVHCRNPI